MIVTKDTSVHFPFYIIKDFLPNPEEYRNIVLNAKYNNTNGFWVGDNVIVPEHFSDKTVDFITQTANSILNDYVWCPKKLITFRRLQQPKQSELAAHMDRIKEFDLDSEGRPLYSRYTFWAFIFDFTPQNKSAKFSFCEHISGEKCFNPFGSAETRKTIVQKDYSQWKSYKDFYYSYNTAIMFPCHYWHTATDFICSKENPRTMGVAWFFSGFNPKYNKCGNPVIDE